MTNDPTSQSRSKTKILGYLFRFLSFVVALGVVGLFVYRANTAGRLTEALVVGTIGLLYSVALVRKSGRSSEVHSFARPTPWIVFALIGGLIWSLGYQPRTAQYRSERSLRDWKDAPFTIHGAHPSMTRAEVTELLGEPTGSTWVYQVTPEGLDAKQTSLLLSALLEEESTAQKVAFGGLGVFADYHEKFVGFFPDRRPPHLNFNPFRSSEREQKRYRELARQENSLFFLWPQHESGLELERRLEELADSDHEELSLVFIFALEEAREPESRLGYASIWKVKRFELLTFEQEGVALDYTEGTDKVDSVHGDQLAFKSRVFAQEGEELGQTPPDWPPLDFIQTLQFSTDLQELDTMVDIANVPVSENRIQIKMVVGKVLKVAIFNTRYN